MRHLQTQPYPNLGVSFLASICIVASVCTVLTLPKAYAEEVPLPASAQEDVDAMDSLPLARCLPQQQTIQAINRYSPVVRWLWLPYRGRLEVQHRRCLKQQSLVDEAQLQSLPGPAKATVNPRKTPKPSKKQKPVNTRPWWNPFKR